MEETKVIKLRGIIAIVFAALTVIALIAFIYFTIVTLAEGTVVSGYPREV